MELFNLRLERPDLYKPSPKEPVFVNVPEMTFIMVDGHGDPNNSKEFSAAVSALYGASFTLKFMIKKGEIPGVDKELGGYKVMPMEGLWWSKNLEDFVTANKANWDWSIMIAQPDFVTAEMLAAAVKKVKAKHPEVPYEKLRLEKMHEGKCATIMHLGPFSAEGPTITRLHQFIHDNGLELSGKHREIYLSDIRKGDPAKWKTVLRQPVK